MQAAHPGLLYNRLNLEYKTENLRLVLVYPDILNKQLFTVILAKEVQRLPP